MLPYETQRRVYSALPGTFDLVTDGGETRRYTISKWWSFQDVDQSSYPAIIIDPQQEGLLRAADTPANEVLDRDDDPADPNNAYVDLRGRRLEAEWNLTCICSGDDGTLPEPRVQILTDTLLDWIEADDHGLNQPGTGENELPVLLDAPDGVNHTSGMVDDRLTARRTLNLRIRYTRAQAESVRKVKDYVQDITFHHQ